MHAHRPLARRLLAPLRLWWIPLGALVGGAAGCGDDGRSGDEGSGANASGAASVGGSGATGNDGQGAAGGGAGGSGVGGTGSGGQGGSAGQGPPLCQLTCGAPADCVTTPNVPYLDADNYACDDGTCQWTGCVSDAECQALVPSYVCRDFFGIPNCFQGCTQPADCALPVQSQDLDNWECVDGGCKTKGCLSDAECQADFGATYRCRLTGVSVPFCSPTCVAPADCATEGGPAFDADNYACSESFCDYVGCESDDACQASLGAAYVCE